MAQARLSMRKIREILRLHQEQGLRTRQIATSVGCALSTVQEGLRQAEATGLGWPLPAELDEAALQARLYPPPMTVVDYPLPDFAVVTCQVFFGPVDSLASEGAMRKSRISEEQMVWILRETD
ncbi:MAG: hypothetical protein ACYDCJ_03080 [Gammaproteobacteria bacterium]